MSFERRHAKHAEGAVLVEFGDTQVLCTASVEDSVPGFLRGKGQGWITAEYGMLPRATHTRTAREAARGRQSGRTQEIQRLIGRSLRAVADLRPRAGTVVVDAALKLPNINDQFQGAGPDIGAYEVGEPLPHYGPRSSGIDEETPGNR